MRAWARDYRLCYSHSTNPGWWRNGKGMGRSETDLLRLLTRISAAGLGERAWKDALEATSEFFGAVGGGPCSTSTGPPPPFLVSTPSGSAKPAATMPGG